MPSEIALLQFFIIIVFRKRGQLGEVVDKGKFYLPLYSVYIYIYSILSEIGCFNFGFRLGFNKINIIAYADYIVLCSHSATDFNNKF